MNHLMAGREQAHIKSFLRYPGSKRRMLDFLGQLIPSAEEIEGRYVEPFVGGGAVFLYTSPRQAILSDVNPDLIDLYRGIRYDPRTVWKWYGNLAVLSEITIQFAITLNRVTLLSELPECFI